MICVRIYLRSCVTLLHVLGYVSWVGKVAERDAVLTEILIECGAVLYVRTNVPQTLMVRFLVANINTI